MKTIWTLGLFAILHDGDSFCVTHGAPEAFHKADILAVVPTRADALRAVAVKACQNARMVA